MPDSPPRSSALAPLLFVLLACTVACVAVSSQSLWTDEAETSLMALQPTIQGWWHTLYLEHNSNLQLPLYMIYIWGWSRLFGTAEVVMRAANVPWFLLGLAALWHFLRRHPALRSTTILLYCLHPFVWYYLNEARPYTMQLSGALLVCGSLFTAIDEPDVPLSSCWWRLFAGGMFILCGAGLLGVIWGIAITIFLFTLPNFRESIARSAIPTLAYSIPLFAALALFYAWTIKEKVGTGTIPMNVPSMFAVFYEQLGFLGLGPGRNMLRSAALSALHPYFIPLLLLGIPLACGLAVAARRSFGLQQGRLMPILLLIGIPLILTFVFSFVRHTRVLGRHFMPMFPFILCAQAYAILLLWKTGRPLARAAAFLIVAALTLSSLEVRFAFRHSKDDNRAAAVAAAQSLAQGKIVWWAADRDPAKYYRLPLVFAALPIVPHSAIWVDKVPSHFAPPPDQIFFSKPDLFDRTGTLAAYITAHHYIPVATWQAFTLWQAPALPR